MLCVNSVYFDLINEHGWMDLWGYRTLAGTRYKMGGLVSCKVYLYLLLAVREAGGSIELLS